MLSSHSGPDLELFVKQALICDVFTEVSKVIGSNNFTGKDTYAKYLKVNKWYYDLLISGKYTFHLQIPGKNNIKKKTEDINQKNVSVEKQNKQGFKAPFKNPIESNNNFIKQFMSDNKNDT